MEHLGGAGAGGTGPARYGFLLSRRWLGLLALALLVAAACVLLGRWQLHRLEHKRAANHLVTSNTAARPVPASDLLAVDRGPGPGRLWRRVQATGYYDTARRLLVRNRPLDGEFGYYVLVPFVTDDGPALLVNRGWVANGENASTPPRVPAPPTGTVTVTARVRATEPASTTGTPPPGQVTRIDVSEIRKTLPYPVYGGFGQLASERPAPRRAPAHLPLPELSEGPHLAYTVQWWLFAVMALGGYVVLARREAADRDAAAGGRPEVVSVPVRG